jgi:hypothetical protein
MMIVDAKAWETEGETEESIERCALLVNKQGGALLAHGRSGFYTDDSRLNVPLIHGQAVLPDLKVTDSSEALLSGRAPPFRLVCRAVRRGGIQIPGIMSAASEPFVVATSRVKSAAKTEIPHMNDHVSKIDSVGVQTQKKLEDIAAAAAAANVGHIQVPRNSVTTVGHFLELVEFAESSRSLRDTMKQVLRLTKGWDVARDHARRAVVDDTQLRAFYPHPHVDVGLLFKTGKQNAMDISCPIGLLRRRRLSDSPPTELVDIIWLSTSSSNHPDAVRKLLTPASAAWWTAGHPGWALLPLTTTHMPLYSSTGHPAVPTSTFTFTFANEEAAAANGSAARSVVDAAAGMEGEGGGNSGTGDGGAGVAPTAAGGGMLSAPSSSSRLNDVEMATLLEASDRPLVTLRGTSPSGEGGAGAGGSPFADPSFQNILAKIQQQQQQVTGGTSGINNGGGGGGTGGGFNLELLQQQQQKQELQYRAAAPTSSGGGTGEKRKADTTLEAFMAMHGSLAVPLELPQGLADVGASLHTLSSMFTSLLLNNNNNNGGPLDPAALAKAAAAAQVLNPLINKSNNNAATDDDDKIGMNINIAGNTTINATGNANNNAARLSSSGHHQPARRPEKITLEEMQLKFAAAAKQEIPYSDLEDWLRQHDLLPPTEAEAAATASRQHQRQRALFEQQQQQQIMEEMSIDADVMAEGGEMLHSLLLPHVTGGMPSGELNEMLAVENNNTSTNNNNQAAAEAVTTTTTTTNNVAGVV